MVDYNKDIEISDDDQTHPNNDTPSLLRWRHQARIERMEERKKELEDHTQQLARHTQKVTDAKSKLAEAEKSGVSDVEDLKKALNELEIEEEKLKVQEDELQKKEKKTPSNVDTISEDGFAKTVINKKPTRPKDENLTEEERENRTKKFIKENEKDLKHFGMLRRYQDSREFLLKGHGALVCEDTANYLVSWCINLAMEDKHELMSHVAHQTIRMQYILELAKQLDYNPGACLDPFFSKLQGAQPEYKASFDDELKEFKERIKKRAAEKIEEAAKEAEEEERKKRLGARGFVPVNAKEYNNYHELYDRPYETI